jgi:predicted ATPase
VGPNASGKTTFLDVIAFLGTLVTDGLDLAISERAQSFKDLVWQQTGDRFELAVQTKIPENLRQVIFSPDYTDIRYEVAIGEQENEYALLEEKVVFLQPQNNLQLTQKLLFPEMPRPVDTIMTRTGRKGVKVIVNKRPGGNDNYYSEKVRDAGKSWAPSFRLGPRKSAFGNLVDDVERFPVSTWFRDYLSTGIQSFMLNSKKLREMSAPGQGKGFSTDGSNLPWVIEDLKKNHPNQFMRWVAHLRSALPDIEEISTEVRPDTYFRYLKIRYQGGLEVPSWMVSDGTLRMLALTLPAYLPDYSGVFLIEEPENGIHPRAVETVFQSLSSVYSAQVMLATHSPIILNMAKLEDVLCFAKTSDGSTDIVAGNDHPLLREWQSNVELGTLLAAGVLG